MKGRGQVPALFYQYWIALIARQDMRALPDAADDGRADEDGFEIGSSF